MQPADEDGKEWRGGDRMASEHVDCGEEDEWRRACRRRWGSGCTDSGDRGKGWDGEHRDSDDDI
jgi:hypothetical protein